MKPARAYLCGLLTLAVASGTACAVVPEQIVLGIALTESNHEAVQLAAAHINDDGGISGVPLRLAGLDWRFSAEASSEEILEWADRFASNTELLALIGHSDSGSTLAGAAVYNQRRLPQIVTIATNPAITNIGAWTYRICLSDAYHGPALADYAVREWGKRRIVVFYVNDDYGRGLAQQFEQRAAELGAEMVASTFHRNILRAEDQQLVRSVLQRLRDTVPPPDLFVLFQRLEAGTWTARAIRDAGYATDILAGDNLGTPAFAAQGEIVEGVRASRFFMPAADDERAQQFVQEYTRVVGREPNYGDAFAYDAVYLFRDAVANGGFSRDGVKRYLDELIASGSEIEGVTGSYVLGSDHDARRSLFIAEVRNGRYELVREISLRR